MLLPRYRDDEPQPTGRHNLNDKLRQIARRDQAITAIVEAGPSTDPTDAQRLRGIPCIAQGVGGTSPGTNPLTETLKSDHRMRYGHRVR